MGNFLWLAKLFQGFFFYCWVTWFVIVEWLGVKRHRINLIVDEGVLLSEGNVHIF